MIQYGYAPRHVDPSPTRWSRWSRQLAAVAAVALALVASVAFATPASAAPTQVVVHRGDQLGQIAKRYCGTVGQYHNLAVGNHIPNPNLIYPGQVIKLTCNATATGNTATRSTTPAKPIPASGWVAPLASMRTTSCYGGRTYFYNGRWVSDFHRGVDLAAGTGTPIRAMSSGTVTRTGWVFGGYGISTVIAHAGSRWSHYAHESRTIVRVGQHVVAGQVIGYSGATGQVTAAHLHVEIATSAYVIGSQINPAVWLRAHGVNVGGC